jgi:hypothetical protein
MMVVYEHQQLKKQQVNLIYQKVTHGQIHPIRQMSALFFHDFSLRLFLLFPLIIYIRVIIIYMLVIYLNKQDCSRVK